MNIAQDGTTPVHTSSITLADATIGYQIRGYGPPLLLIPGGAGDAGVFGPLAEHLMRHHTVISMHSRTSRADVDHGEQDPGSHAADTVALLDELGTGPVDVFGTSSGAITALALVSHHPDRVRRAVIHEAPLVNALPDAARQREMLRSVRHKAHTAGVSDAMAALAAGLGEADVGATAPQVRRPGDWHAGYADTASEPPTPELSEVFARLAATRSVFLERILVPFATHPIDGYALRDVAPRLVPAAGIDSCGQLPYRAMCAVAQLLDSPLWEVPGGHLGPVERPTQFATALRALFLETS